MAIALRKEIDSYEVIMSFARYGSNKGQVYSNIVRPFKVDASFVVDPTNVNGLGISSLKSNGYINNIFMKTSASFTGTLNTSTSITSIASTANLAVGMQVFNANIPAKTFITAINSATAITISKAATATGSTTITYAGINNGVVSPNPGTGYFAVQFKQNFNACLGGYAGFVSPQSTYTTGSYISISGSSVLTLGAPYIITSVGAVPAATFTVAPVADVAGNSAGQYITISDVAGNNFVIYNVVGGIGTPPALTGALNGYTAVPLSYASGATAATIGAALASLVATLNSALSFTASGTTTVTVTNALSSSLPFLRNPSAGTTSWTVSAPTFTSLAADWQSVGLPQGFVPTLNQSFFATATGSALGTGKVIGPTASGIASIELIGDPNQLDTNSNIDKNAGAIIAGQFLGPTNSTTTTIIPVAPAAKSVVSLSFWFDSSSASVDGL